VNGSIILKTLIHRYHLRTGKQQVSVGL